MTKVEQLKELIVHADEIEEEIEGEGSKAATKRKVESLITAACEEGTPIKDVLDEGLIAGMEKTVKALKDRGVSARTMIGGAPVTQGYADRIGADGYAADAASAVGLAKSLIT